MRISLLIISVACLLPNAMSAQDDVYYIPSKEVRQVKTNDGTILSTIESNESEQHVATRDVDEYNRRSTISSVSSENYFDDSIPMIESSFDNSSEDADFLYTKRVMRFYSPRPGIIISSPYYWDICYSDVWDAYYDGWALYVPSYSWWSYSYDPWYYNRWAFRTCWDFTWGWHDRWWGYSYWGWSRPIYWGWNRPYVGPRHYGGRLWAGHGFGRGYAPGFGRNGGRVFAGRGYDVGRSSYGGIGGRIDGFGGRGSYNGGRNLSGVFRSDRTPSSGRAASSGGSRQGVRQDRSYSGGGGVMRSGRSYSGSSREGQVNRNTTQSYERGSSRNNTPFYDRSSSPRSSSPNYERNSSGRNSTPSYGGGGARNSSPSYRESSRSSSPSYGGGGGGVSRGGVSRGGRR